MKVVGSHGTDMVQYNYSVVTFAKTELIKGLMIGTGFSNCWSLVEAEDNATRSKYKQAFEGRRNICNVCI